MENLANYFTGQGYASSQDVEADSDGVVRLVVAAEKPATGFWVDSAGRDHGVMGLRFLEHESVPVITTKLVRFSDLG